MLREPGHRSILVSLLDSGQRIYFTVLEPESSTVASRIGAAIITAIEEPRPG